MTDILFINHNIQNCGVYQYGKRVASISKKSKIFNFQYAEISSKEDLILQINQEEPKILIYNYVTATMPWLDYSIINYIRSLNIKQGNIIHNTQYNGFDFYLHQNPNYINNNNNFRLLRPLFEYIPKNKIENSVLQIGTFGFGGQHKFIPEICELISKQFLNKKVEINIHVTKGFYSDDVTKEIEKKCIQKIGKKENLKLNFTNKFLPDEAMLDFLYKNDLNIFFYENYNFYNGISSSIDYALSVKKPIAVCKSNMFSHIIDVNPSICVEDIDLIDIINNGFKTLENKYELWSNKNFIDNIETIIKSVL